MCPSRGGEDRGERQRPGAQAGPGCAERVTHRDLERVPEGHAALPGSDVIQCQASRQQLRCGQGV